MKTQKPTPSHLASGPLDADRNTDRDQRRSIHIAGFAQLPNLAQNSQLDPAEMVQAVVSKALRQARLPRSAIGFVCSGSNDYGMGRPFSFTTALDGLGAWPPARESHVEMDGAWALYEAYVRLQHGDIDAALVYAFGASSIGDSNQVQTLELDPYHLAPLGVDPLSLAALQARCLLDKGLATERSFAEVVSRSRASALSNPNALARGKTSVETLLETPYVREPLRAFDGPTPTDGAAAIVLRAGTGGPRIRGMAHVIDVHHPGMRDLTDSPSTRKAAALAGGVEGVEVAELYAKYASQEGILVRALGLGPDVRINPSGGVLCALTPMVAGLIRIGEAASAVRAGAKVALAHASSGPLLQHNLVCVLEA